MGNTKAAIVALSNPLTLDKKEEVDILFLILKEMKIDLVISDFIFREETGDRQEARKRAEECNGYFAREDIDYIFDISGGDVANELVTFLDYKVITRSKALFIGYSDLTVIINAILSKTNKVSLLYQVRNITKCKKRRKELADFLKEYSQVKRLDNKDYVFKNSLTSFEYDFIQGDLLEGKVVGGNIRCLLKLAGSEYFPNLKGKVLLLESLSGSLLRMITFFNQLDQLGAFKEISGLILGNFCQCQEEGKYEALIELARQFVAEDISIIKSNQLGHYSNSKGIIIGEIMKKIKKTS